MAYIQTRKTKEGETSYRVQVRIKGYPMQTATFDRKTDAQKWAQDTESAIRNRRHFPTNELKRRNIKDLIDKYIKETLAQKPKRLKDVETKLDWWKEQIGAYSLAELNRSLINDARQKLIDSPTAHNAPRSSSTVNRYMVALGTAINIAVNEWEWLETNPMRKISKLKEPRGRVRFLSDDERTKLLTACQANTNPYLYTIVVLALSTGARQGEILNLTWDNVDFNRKVITLHETKNNERRVLPITAFAYSLLNQHSKIRRIDTKLLFPSITNPEQPMNIHPAWHRALKVAKIDNFRFHDLRHSAASYLAMNGASLAEIAEVLGHKTLSMVKRYSHLSEAHTAKVVESMNKKIFGEVKNA